jgi:hypothetical protein
MNDTAIAVPGSASGRRTLAPTTFTEAMEFAKALAQSSMVPNEYRGRPENIVLAMQWGMELGLAPLQAIQNIAVINGKPSVYGDALLAMVRGSPVCEDVIEGFEGSGDTLTAICEARRKGRAPVTARFSVADAKKANLWGKSGPWTQYPRRMLQMRARGFALRDAFPDVLRGVISREEAQDYPVDVGQPRGMVDVTPKADLDNFAAAPAAEVVDGDTGEVFDEAAMLAQGDAAAEGGTEGFLCWWNSAETKPLRDGLRSHLERWRVIAKSADERGGPAPETETADEDPFGLPPIEHHSPAGTEPQPEPSDAKREVPAGEPDEIDNAWIRRVMALEPERDLLSGGGPHWPSYAGAIVTACQETNQATRGALRVGQMPHLLKMRTEDGDSYARVREALAGRW